MHPCACESVCACVCERVLKCACMRACLITKQTNALVSSYFRSHFRLLSLSVFVSHDKRVMRRISIASSIVLCQSIAVVFVYTLHILRCALKWFINFVGSLQNWKPKQPMAHECRKQFSKNRYTHVFQFQPPFQTHWNDNRKIREGEWCETEDWAWERESGAHSLIYTYTYTRPLTYTFCVSVCCLRLN